MNGNYTTADSPKARMAVVFKSCMELYYHLHPSHRYMGFAPDYSFIADYIGTFLDKELDSRAEQELKDSVEPTSESVQARIRELRRKNEEHDREIAAQLNISELGL